MTGAFPGKRIRDPVHGLIVFEAGNERDELAWKLLSVPEMQRLRRIRQLGVSEFVFPGATHSRFAHSIGVFHCARRLVKIIEREIGEEFEQDKANIAILAALLHDVGHGPFSHAFEGVQHDRGIDERHEKWTAEIIRNPKGDIASVLGEEMADAIAGLFERDDPENIYDAVVSSSFDADRLDYLQRDKLMTGTGAGAIDFDWLMDNLRVAEINLAVDDEDDEGAQVPTFCFASKAQAAAEQFLLARYTLHEQVYFHKVTRCIEKMVGRLLSRIAELARNEETMTKQTGLPKDHPLLRFFVRDGDTIGNYLALDDMVVLGALELMKQAGDDIVTMLATCLRDRQPYKTLDIGEFGSDHGRQRMIIRKIEKNFADALKTGAIIKDEEARINIYSEIGQDEERMHKRLHVFDGTKVKEISQLSALVAALGIRKEDGKTFTRFYFEKKSDRDRARNIEGNKP